MTFPIKTALIVLSLVLGGCAAAAPSQTTVECTRTLRVKVAQGEVEGAENATVDGWDVQCVQLR